MAETDLKIIPLARKMGRKLDTLPGLHVAEPPRRASRSRRADKLILLLSFDGPSFSDERLADLLTRLEGIYYQKTGSTTSAMRELIEELNNLIFNLNLKYAGERPQVSGTIGVIVVRGDLFFLAQSGPGHLFALLPGKVDYLHDDHLNMRGLGTSRTATVYYAQLQFAPGDRFIFSTTLPDGWDANTFTAAYDATLENAQRLFLADAGDNLVGVIIDAEAGTGKLNLLQPPAMPLAQPQIPSRQADAHPIPSPPTTLAPERKPAAIEQTPPVVSAPPPAAPEQKPPPRKRVESRSAGENRAVFQTEPSLAPTETSWEPEGPQPRGRRGRSSSLQARQAAASLAPALLKGLTRLQNFGRSALLSLKKILQRIMPGDELGKIPTSTMAFIAVAVPLLLVTIAALVYAQIGRNKQYEHYLSQAEIITQAALAEDDISLQREAWQQAVTLADTALSYLATSEAEALRQQAMDALDNIDQVERLTLEDAISGTLSNSIKIRKMAATSRELYMLDINSDSVIHARLTGSRFEMDSDFHCGAGKYGSIIVSDLIDIALLPDNPDKAALVAMDRGGNLLYCYQDDKPPVAITLTPPDSYWGKPIAITVENDKLYVLDEQLNMVWFYNPSDPSYQFRDAPYFYFTDEVPNMQETVDFAVDQDKLYLLYVDGRTTTCTYTGLEEAPATCTSPALYEDTRPGRTPAETISDAVFYQIQHTQPPEPSLYYLDPINRAVYHFSVKLKLIKQFRPEEGLEEGYITAFAVSPTKTIFLAMENKVYLSHLP
ncbi:MAG: hypothetical protein JW757_08045 [Anaerolineales bacterium]|nr:hypothetical protein [Anaerolineales bacterium]